MKKIDEETTKEIIPEEITMKMFDEELEKRGKELSDEEIKQIALELKTKEKEDETKRKRGEKTKEEIWSTWVPKTKLGKEVKSGKIKNIDDILKSNRKILEEEIVDVLLNLKSDLISIGQSKGKFGGGKRRAWRQTQRKTKEGNVPTFSSMAVVGDERGHVGIGSGKGMETLPARDKGLRKAKLNIIKVNRTCASFDCVCSEPHTIPFKITGKSGGVRVTLIPAAQGTGLVVARSLKSVLSLAGIKDIYSRTEGKKRTTFNLVKACINALEKTNSRGEF